MTRRVILLSLVAAALLSDRILAQAPLRRILFDEAHHNLMASALTGYRPFVQLVIDAGYEVGPNRLPFTSDRLASADILVIVNPNGAEQSAPVERRAGSATTEEEADVVRDWVRGGGRLLLITDHYPTAVAARALAERFDVRLSGGWTDGPRHRRSLPGYGSIFGYLVFSRENGLLGDHAITKGRAESERVLAVTTVTGGSMNGPDGAVSILRLSETAVDHLPRVPGGIAARAADGPRDFNPCPACDTASAEGRSQALAFTFGRGRVVVVGEMGALIEFSVPGMDNRQFALNIVRWLSGDL